MNHSQPVVVPDAEKHGAGELFVMGTIDNFYVSPVLKALKTLRYTKRTCTLAGFHIVARSQLLNRTKFEFDWYDINFFLDLCILN